MLTDKTDFFAYKDNFARYKDIESILLYDACANKDPFVTIAIPTYKRAQLLKDALDSALNQINFDNYEVIVVDNEDIFDTVTETEKLIKSYSSDKLKYYRNKKNIRMFGNWNRCIELAKGEWITILNDDDMLANNYLETVSQYIEDKTMIIVDFKRFGKYANILANEKKHSSSLIKRTTKEISNLLLGINKNKIELFDLFLANPVHGSLGALFHRSIAFKIGGYNEDFAPSADYIYTVMYYKEAGIKKVPVIGAYYRWDQNESLKKETIEGMLKIGFFSRINLINNFIQNKLIKYILFKLNIQHTKLRAYKFSIFAKKAGIHDFDYKNQLKKLGLKNNLLLPRLSKKVIPKLITIFVKLGTKKYCYNSHKK